MEEVKKEKGRAINRLRSMHPLRAKIDKSYLVSVRKPRFSRFTSEANFTSEGEIASIW